MSVSTTYDMTAANAGLKELYENQKVENLVYKERPFLALLKKKPDFQGKYKPLPVISSNGQGRSSSFTYAQNNETAPELESFLITTVNDYAVASIDNKTMMSSASDKGSFLRASEVVIDSHLNELSQSISSALFRSGTGSIGKISTITSGVIVLDDPNSVVQFGKNMTLQVASSDGGSARTALGYVISVDRSLGKITVAASLGGSAATPSSWAANDYINVQGDLNAKCKGLAAWIPTTAPTGGDNFFGVDRSVDSTRLAGVRYDGSNLSIEEALIEGSNLLAREGGKPDVAIMGYAAYSALLKSLGSKVQYIDMKGPAQISFKGIQIAGANSMINVFPDRDCPQKLCYLLTMSSWALESVGPAPMIQKSPDGLEMLRISNADAGEVRMCAYFQLTCNAPGYNAVVQLGA